MFFKVFFLEKYGPGTSENFVECLLWETLKYNILGTLLIALNGRKTLTALIELKNSPSPYANSNVLKRNLNAWLSRICHCSLLHEFFQNDFRRTHYCANFNPLSTNFTKWSNTLKQFVGKLPTNCLSVFDHFVGLGLNGLSLTAIYSHYSNTP